MVPVGSYSDPAEQNYDLPPPPDILNDANSQSTASIDVCFIWLLVLTLTSEIRQAILVIWIYKVVAMGFLRLQRFQLLHQIFQRRPTSSSKRFWQPSNLRQRQDFKDEVPVIQTGRRENFFKKELRLQFTSSMRVCASHG